MRTVALLEGDLAHLVCRVEAGDGLVEASLVVEKLLHCDSGKARVGRVGVTGERVDEGGRFKHANLVSTCN